MDRVPDRNPDEGGCAGALGTVAIHFHSVEHSMKRYFVIRTGKYGNVCWLHQ